MSGRGRGGEKFTAGLIASLRTAIHFNAAGGSECPPAIFWNKTGDRVQGLGYRG